MRTIQFTLTLAADDPAVRTLAELLGEAIQRAVPRSHASMSAGGQKTAENVEPLVWRGRGDRQALADQREELVGYVEFRASAEAAEEHR